MPVEDSVFVVVLPNDFEHGKNILDWALQNGAKDAERLVVVHAHEQTSPNELKEKLGEFVAMCGKSKVKCVQLNEDDVVVEGLRKKHIELKDITNLVVGVKPDELHSEITQSLDSQPMRTEAPSCKIHFIDCGGDAMYTRHLARNIDDSWITRILEMSRNNHRPSSPHKLEINTSASADVRDCFTSVLEMVKRLKKENKRKLGDVNSKESDLKKEIKDIKIRMGTASPSRWSRLRDKKKNCERNLEDVNKEKSNLQKEGKQIEDMETAIKFLKQMTTNEYFLLKREKAVTEAGGQDVKNNLQTTLALLVDILDGQLRKEAYDRPIMHQDSEASTSALEMVIKTEKEYQHKLDEVISEKYKLERNLTNLEETVDEDILTPKRLSKVKEDKENCKRELQDAENEKSYIPQAESQAPDHTISCVLRVDPHIAADGHTKDPKSINAGWFTHGNDISPVLREMIQDKKLIRDLKWKIESWMVERQGQVRTLTVCDPNPVQSSQQGHPTIPPAAQSQPPTDLHPDPVTSRPPDTTSASSSTASSSTYSSTLSRVLRLLREDDDDGSPTLSLPPPTRIRQRWA